MKQDQITNQSRIRTATKVEGADNVNSSTPEKNNGDKGSAEERKKVDFRYLPKTLRRVFHEKRAEMKLGVINNFGNVLSQENVTIDGLENSVEVNENAIISSAIVGRIVPKKNGKGLDLRYLKKDFRTKYHQVEGDARAEMERQITEKVTNLQTITNDDYLEILTMANLNPFAAKFVTDDEPKQTNEAKEFEIFIKGNSGEVKAQ